MFVRGAFVVTEERVRFSAIRKFRLHCWCMLDWW